MDPATRIVVPATEEECIRLIGDLLCKGILRSPGLRAADVNPETAPPLVIPSPEERILDHLGRHHAASPGEMRVMLGLSRTRVHRALQYLRLTGQVVQNGGRTTAAFYQLVDPSRN